MAASKRLRYEILRRDNHRCRYCGAAAPDARLTVDHVVPASLGGSDDPSNLVTACADCNSGKSASNPDAPLVADVEQDQLRWVAAMHAVIEQRAAELRDERNALARFNQVWQAHAGVVLVPRDATWKNSVCRFMAAGLDEEFLADAVATAMGNSKLPPTNVWRYFCGICWREIEQLQERARKYLVAGEPDDAEDPDMPLMEMFSSYLEILLPEFCVDERVQKIAQRALWEGMSEADQVYRGCSPYTQPPAPGERLEEAREFLSGWIAPDMSQIRLLLREAGDSDGAQ